MFILNLAFSEMLYCITNLPMYSVEVGLAYLGMIPQVLLRSWPGSHMSCQAFAMFRYFNAFASWMSVAMVAFSRYFFVVVHSLCILKVPFHHP